MSEPENFCSIVSQAMERLPLAPLATLSLHGRLVATGRANINEGAKTGAFHPIDGSVLDATPDGLRLKFLNTGAIVDLKDFRPCPAGGADYHFAIGSADM